MSGRAAPFCLRAEAPSDEAFLARLFASTRAGEIALLAGAPAAVDALLRMQREAQRRAYEARYPAAERSIVVIDGEPAGRLIVDRSGPEVILVDVALLPERRGQGAGAALVREVLDAAASSGKDVALHVAQTNPAKRLYQRLGFIRVGGDAIYDAMKWSARPIAAAPT